MPILPTDIFLLLSEATTPIISVPPHEPPTEKNIPAPKPTIKPPIKVLVISSSTIGVLGIGINDKAKV